MLLGAGETFDLLGESYANAARLKKESLIMNDFFRWSASFQFLLFLFIFAGPELTAAHGAMTVGETRCEYALNPIGITTLTPRLNWTLLDDKRGQRQTAYEIRVADTSDGLENPNGLLWDTGKVVSDQNTGIVYAGKGLQSGSRCYWQVRAWDKDGQPTPWSAPAFWQVALLSPSDWKASWIGLPNDPDVPPDPKLSPQPVLPKDCPRLRKDFVLDNKPIRRATISVCGLGFYEVYLNGEKADDRVLAPADTVYATRLLYDTIDVTTKLKAGPNAVGLWLAPGYSDDYTKYKLTWAWLHPKRAILQLDVVYEDGTTTSILSDGSWKAGKSPITYASIYHGEVYDARLETPGWATAGFADQDWQPVAVLSPLGGPLTPNAEPPIRVVQTFRPVNVAEPKPGVFVFDLGQNFSGWARLRATGPSGTTIVMHYSELTSKDGMIDPWTNRHAKNTDTFILKGDGSETYEPRFTYHGFRYVEVTGYPGTPTLDDLTGCVIQADVKPAGTFVSSDKVLNQIDSNCSWSMRSNTKSTPTDCTQRDERTACEMDVLAYEDSALYHFWMDPFYTKWENDISGYLVDPNPDWVGNMVFLPWQMYWQYGDRRILEDHYADMAAYVDFLHAKAPDDIYTKGYGDWCRPNKGSWLSFYSNVTDVDTSMYAAITRIVSQTAAVLGKTDDATRYGRLADEITRTYNEKRFNATTAAYGDGSQTTAILPLALGLVPQDERAAVFAHLVATIQGKDKGHLDTGILGTRYLGDVLCDFGEPDLAVTLLTQPTYPSYGYEIAQGATTVWEQWYFKGGMDTHNHGMFSGASATFYSRFAGITPLQPGYAQISIRPVMPKSLSYVDASLKTVKGTVSVKWQRDGGKIVIDTTIPVNTTARVAVPAANAQAVTESGQPADRAEDVTYAGMENGCAVFTVGSGTYHFAASDLLGKN